MNIMRRIGVTGLLAAVALNAWAAGSAPKSAAKEKFDVTGTWAATAESGRGPASNLVFVLKQDGDKLSGTLATNGGAPVEISAARVLRSTIYFEVDVAAGMPARPAGPQGGPPGMGGMGGRKMIMKYTGSIAGDELKITAEMKREAQDGDGPTGVGNKTEMVAKRQ